MKRGKSCKDCLMGVRMIVNGDILCRFNGAVSPDYICPRYRFAPRLAIEKAEAAGPNCSGCVFFMADGIAPDGSQTIGFCQLFTVRRYNGEHRAACSKFTPKMENGQSRTG